jgi:glucose uptake protein
MFIPQNYPLTLLMLIVSAICWGSWANTLKGTKNYRFELFYLDYALGCFLISLILAFTIGSLDNGPQSFLNNALAAAPDTIGSALIGGAIFNVANLLLVAGIDMAGLAVAVPVSIGIALVVGVVLSYALQPTGNAMLLSFGVLLAVGAVIMNGKAYASLASSGRSVSRKSIVVCVISGVLMGLFAPFVTHSLTSAAPLTPYSVAVFFTLGALLCCFVPNVYFMKHPLVGEPVVLGDFFKASMPNHLLGLAGGIIWGLGTVLNFVGASCTGVAISYAIGQSAPMVAALWGVGVFKEFAGASRKSYVFLSLMFLFYVLAICQVAMAHTAAHP